VQVAQKVCHHCYYIAEDGALRQIFRACAAVAKGAAIAIHILQQQQQQQHHSNQYLTFDR
jgi:hypothetical protein